MSGTLYVVPTPLGNLEDITLRAVRLLGEVDLVAAEDTRHSRKLLEHLGIRKRPISYQQHAKQSGIARILAALDSGDVALISDAGTPSIADPGFELISEAVTRGYRVEVLPGPSAVTSAYALAALPARGFIFLGFLPRRKAELVRRLDEVASLPYALVIFEAPHRVRVTLNALLDVLGDRPAVAVRELSKVHEEAIRGTLEQLLERVSRHSPRGEWTLVVGPGSDAHIDVSSESVQAELDDLRAAGVTARDAALEVSTRHKLRRSEVYEMALRGERRI